MQPALSLLAQMKTQFLEEGSFHLQLFLGFNGDLKRVRLFKIKVKLYVHLPLLNLFSQPTCLCIVTYPDWCARHVNASIVFII
jgi:hypothetical protein